MVFFGEVDVPALSLSLTPALQPRKTCILSVFYVALLKTILNNKHDRLMAVRLHELK